MIKNAVIIIVILMAITIPASARDMIDNFSTAQLSMGRTALLAENTYSVAAANPALLKATAHITAGISYQSYYDLNDIYLINDAASYNTSRFSTGILIAYFGDFKIFEERRFTLSGAYNLPKILSIGLKIDYSSITFDYRYQALDEFSFGAGIAAYFEQFILHASLSEINQPRLTTADRKTKPGYRIGMHFNNNANIILNIEVSGHSDGDPQYHFGQELRIEKHYFLRFGVMTNPTQPSIGLGISWKNYTFHYSLNSNSDLGQTHSFGISVNL